MALHNCKWADKCVISAHRCKNLVRTTLQRSKRVVLYATTMTTRISVAAVYFFLLISTPASLAQAVVDGPIGPSPYDVVRGWHKPFSAPGFAFGGNSGVFAESPDRIFVAQRGEFQLPSPVPPDYAGFAGSLKMNVLSLVKQRVWQNCLYTLD